MFFHVITNSPYPIDAEFTISKRRLGGSEAPCDIPATSRAIQVFIHAIAQGNQSLNLSLCRWLATLSLFQNTLLTNFNKPTTSLRWSATGKGPKPETGPTKKIVGYWLLGCSGMVFVAVVLGVYTIETWMEEVTKLTVKK